MLLGDEAEGQGEARFLPFLEALCAQKPRLRVYILAWDFSVVYAAEREWFQHWRFNRTAHERLTFRTDNSHPVTGAQHHKIVVVDGLLAFVGGMDLCADRWDERDHRKVHPGRVNPGGKAYGPYHDIQAVVTGPAVGALQEFFRERWAASGGEEMVTPPPLPGAAPPALECTLPIGPAPVGISRTLGANVAPMQPPVREIRQLYLDAIASAEHLIYIENQYFTSAAVRDALIARMRDASRPGLHVVILMPIQPENSVEELALGLPQARVLRRLEEVAAETGQALGIYCTAPDGSCHDRCATYIHSKLMIVDDALLVMGSANANNRSLGLDTEINLTWEARGPGEERLRRAIRKIRTSLLAEHVGARSLAALRSLARVPGLVSRLDRMTGEPGCRLFCRETIEAPSQDGPLASLAATAGDPEQAHMEEELFEALRDEPDDSLIVRGLGALGRLLAS